MPDCGDGELVERCLAGRTDAFRVLVSRYGVSVSRYLRARSIPTDSVDDLAQDVFLRAYQSLGSLADRSAFAGWLFAIARSRALDWLRGHGRALRRTAVAGVEPADPSPGPEGAAVAREDVDRVRRAIDDLPEVFRTTLRLKHQQHLSCKEIADVQGVGIGTVTKRLSRAYAMLRERLEERGGP